MVEALSFGFMQNALAAGLLAGVVCGVVGTFVVVNRIVFISGGIAHAAYGGVGLAFFFGLTPLVGILGFTLAAALVMAAVTLRSKHRADAMVGVLWAVGMALGIILVDLTPGYNADLLSYLFGSVLTAPAQHVWLLLGLTLLVIGFTAYFYHGLVAMSYDEEFAVVRGVPVRFLYFALMIIIALSVVMVIQVVGLILVIALMTIAPYMAERYASSLPVMMIAAAGLNALFVCLGLWLSYSFDLTSGASIILTAGVCFFVLQAVERLLPRRAAAAERD